MEHAQSAQPLVETAPAEQTAQVALMDPELTHIPANVMILTSMTMEHVQHAQPLV